MDTTGKYWEQVVNDYISCLTEDTFDDLDDNTMRKIIIELLDDEEMWGKIDETIYYYLNRFHTKK
jgi:hypothetical protein